MLQATDPKALVNWLAANKYHLPDKAVGPMRGYVKQGWTFVASRIKIPANAKGLRTGTLAPLRLTFKAAKPIYPLRLSSANPKQFDLLVYLLLPTKPLGGKQGSITITGHPDRPSGAATLRRAELARYQKSYPTLAKLTSDEMQVFVERSRPQPSQCSQDLVWTLPAQRD